MPVPCTGIFCPKYNNDLHLEDTMLPFRRIITSSKKNIQPSVTKIASSDTTVFALMSDGTLYSRESQEFGLFIFF